MAPMLSVSVRVMAAVVVIGRLGPPSVGVWWCGVRVAGVGVVGSRGGDVPDGDGDEHGVFRLDASVPVEVTSFSGGEIGGL